MKIINVKNYDMKKESLHLVYWDINNMYGWATSQKLNDFKWVEERSQLMNISIYIYIYIYIYMYTLVLMNQNNVSWN